MRSKGLSPQTMGKTCPFPIHIWVSDPSGSRQQQLHRVYWSRPGCLQDPHRPPADPGRGRPGSTGMGPDWRHRAARSRTFPQKPRRDRHRSVLRRGTRPGRAPLPNAGLPRPRFSLPRFPSATAGRGFMWDFRKSGVSTRLGAFLCVLVFCLFVFFTPPPPPERRLYASRIRPRYLCKRRRDGPINLRGGKGRRETLVEL